MANSLPPVEFATITGRFMIAGNDASDPNTWPDVIPAKGKGRIIPSVGQVLVSDSVPPATVKLATVQFELDAQGYISNPETKLRDVEVVAPSGAVNPSNFTYRIEFDGTQFLGFDFLVTSGGTVDLTKVGRVATSPGIAITRGEPGVGIVSLDLSEDETAIVVSYEDGTAQSVAVPALGEAKEFRDEAQVAATAATAPTDAMVATKIQDPGSQTRAALDAVGNATYGTEAWADPESDVRQVAGGLFPAKVSGPRSLPRIRHGLKPTLHVDALYPRSGYGEWNHRILSVRPGEWWAYGRDGSLRTSINGDLWFQKYRTPNAGEMGRQGMWLKTTAGSLLTTWHAEGSTPTIIRSTNGGTTWTTVVASTPGVQFLGPCSLIQSPATGNLFLIEYTTATAAVVPETRIKVSADDGATWTVWKALPRDTANPAHVTHGHSLFVDPIDNRIWAAIGDAPQASGIYRFNAAETDWSPVATNAQLDTANGIWGGAVGMMFFPDYIAWGVDQSYSSGLTRMARSEIGKPTPNVELVMRTNSTCFYTARSRTDNAEWVMCASQEGSAGAIDNAIHFYRVADNGATVDELSSIPHYQAGPSFSWAFPLGDPLTLGPEGMMWWGTNAHDGIPNLGDPSRSGIQFSARVGWSNDVIVRPAASRKFESLTTLSTGHIASLAQNASLIFGSTMVPQHLRRLYLINAGASVYGGSGASNPVIEVVDAAGAVITDYVGSPLAVDIKSAREFRQEDTAPFLTYTAKLTPGSEVRFRIRQVTGQAIPLTGFITFAWGY